MSPARVGMRLPIVIAGEVFDGYPQSVSPEKTVEIENRTGLDSIPTIERIYDRTPKGKFVCVFPDCRYTTLSAGGMWLHVHGGRARRHGTLRQTTVK